MPRRLAFLLMTTFLVLFMWTWPAGAAQESDESPELVLEVMELIREYQISNPDTSALSYGAIQGMLYELDDDYADYFSPEELDSYIGALNGDLVGIGVELQAAERHPVVVTVLPGTPAERGGVQQGDVLLAVDGKSTADRPLEELVLDIQGSQGNPVELTIKRGESEFDITLERADVHVPTIKSEMLAGNTGYIAVSSFGETTTGAFESALRELQGQGMKSLIIDLRGNGGGLLEAAVNMLDNFISRDSLVISKVDGRGQRDEVCTVEEPTVSRLPMVVLVDWGSASASEVMAAALRDYGLAKLVGDVTFGKGVVQTMIPLSNGGGLKITVSEYLTSTGTKINEIGLKPDHQVLIPALQKEVAWMLLNPGDDPDLSFTAGGEALLNGRKTGLHMDVVVKGNREYLPLRAVLESMLFQVNWDNDAISVMEGDKEKISLKVNSGKGNPGVIVQDEINYLAVDLFRQLNINVIKNGKNYKIQRQI